MNRKTAIDPAVADLLGNLDRQSAQRSQPAAQRKRQAKERQKLAARHRVTYDLPETLTARLEQIAQEQGCPVSQIAAILIQRGLNELDAGALNLTAYRQPSKSPRYAWNLIYTEDDK